MNIFLKTFCTLVVAGVISINASYAVSTADCKEVMKITKKMAKFSDRNNIDKLAEYYSENYRSFDGYNRDEIIKIYKIANRLYPNSKTKEKITNVEAGDDYIKVFFHEQTKTRTDVKGEDAVYAVNEKIKGVMNSVSDYSVTFKKEDEKWVIVTDEIYNETTEIKYGEAINADFQMEIPESIKPGEEFTVKTTLKMPEDRFVVGSIGHDKIVFPPEKYFDPYRAVDNSGILERVMHANKEGKNEYANSTFAFITPQAEKSKDGKNEKIKASISGMGIYVKRINTKKEDIL